MSATKIKINDKRSNIGIEFNHRDDLGQNDPMNTSINILNEHSSTTNTPNLNSSGTIGYSMNYPAAHHSFNATSANVYSNSMGTTSGTGSVLPPHDSQ